MEKDDNKDDKDEEIFDPAAIIANPWLKILKEKFDRHQTKRKGSHMRDLKTMNYKSRYFLTGSHYVGLWNVLGMQGSGQYTFPHDTIYHGAMHDSTFHGAGTLRYPNSSRFMGTWENGIMVDHQYFYEDSVAKTDGYCEMPDRRYVTEHRYGLQPAGRSIITNSCPCRITPAGCYDTGDGFYDPTTKCVYHPKDHEKVVRIPTQTEHEWILKNCRKGWDEPVGYRPDLYENWAVKDVEKTEKTEKTDHERDSSEGSSEHSNCNLKFVKENLH